MKKNARRFFAAALTLLMAGGVRAAILPTPTVTSSATAYNASFVPANLFDSNTGTEYASQTLGAGPAFSTSAGTWIQFDFGTPVTMDRMLLMSRANTADIIGNYRLILSNDPAFDASDSVFTLTNQGSNRSAPVLSFTPTTARYARWEVATSVGTVQNLGGVEMRFLSTPAGSARISPVTVYNSATQFNASYAAVNSMNNNAGWGAGYEYACLSLGPNMFVDFDFGSVQPVNGFDLFDRIPTVDRTMSFNLIFDDDSATFASPVATLSFSPGSVLWGYSQTFSSINARYVRLDATSTNSSNNNSGIQEIYFYKETNLNAPLVANAAATGITATGATVGGNVTRVGVDTPSVTLYYGTVNGGTTVANWQNTINLGPQTGAFSTNLSGLQPFTRYYYTTFAQNTAGANWATAPLEFATPVAPPVVANLAASELTIATARVGATVTSTGGRAPVVTLYYGPSDGGTNPAAWQQQVSLGAVAASNSTVIGGLSANTTYYFRVFGAHEGGSAWAPSTASFTTPVAALPAVTNSPATQINAFSASLNGQVTGTGNAPTTVAVYYGPADGGTNAASWAFSADAGLQTGNFTTLVTNLTATTPYYFRARALNAAGAAWAPSSATFTTTAFTPVTVYLNEFVAKTDNDDPHPHYDVDGSPEDWIEIFNPGGSAVDIGGYYLTDNAGRLDKWRFPTPTIIPANGFLVVFASNKDRRVSGQQLHTNFRLSDEGEYLALVQPDAATVIKSWSPAFPAVPEYWSYGLTLPSSGGAYAPFQIPTPGAANTTAAGPPAGDVIFSIPSQTFAGASVQLSLTTASPTAQIRFTTNRTEPTAASTLYSGTLTISTTTQIRARAFETVAGFAPGLVHSETYVKLGTGAATFTSNLPVVVVDTFISAPASDVSRQMFWTLFTPNAATSNRSALTNAPALATRGRMVIRGATSAGWPKYSMNIEAWDEFNEDTDVAPLGMAPEADWILQSNYDFDRGMIRNPFMYEFSNRIGRWAPRWRFVEVFANTNDGTLDYPGDYMGVYALMEKPERGADRIDIERLDFNDLTGDDVTGGYIVKIDRLDPGTSGWLTSRNFPQSEPYAAYLNYGYPEEAPAPAPAIPAQQSAYIRNYIQALEDTLVQPNRTHPTTGLYYTDYIDRDSWVDHGLLNILSQNADCFRLSTYMYKPRLGKLFAGPIWDFDRTMGSTDSRSTSPLGWSAVQPATDIMTWGWWKYLWTDPDFWQIFTDRWFELRDGVLTNANLTGLITQFEGELSEAAVRNYARWTATPPRDGPDAGTAATFSDEMDIMRTWITGRTAWVDSQFVPRPVRAPAGGQTGSVTLTATQGTIYYTLDGSDPRLPGGALNPAALTLASGAPVTVSGSTLLFARAKTATLWSAPSKGYYFGGTPAGAANLVVTELNYHPADPSPAEQTAGFTNSDEFEFIELMNASAGSIDLSGCRFTAGIDFTFPLNVVLTPGQRTIVVASRAAFAARHSQIPFANIAGEFLNDRLENAGELVRLESAAGAVILEFTYGTRGVWPEEADGSGRSLVLIKPAPGTNLNAALNWRASAGPNGTPLGGDGITYAAWKAAHSVPSDSADDDNDGISPFGEYSAGSDPAEASLSRLPAVQRDAGGNWVITVTRSLTADDADFTIQSAVDPNVWSDAVVTIESRTVSGDTEQFVCRLNNPPAAFRFFLRTRWTVRP